MGWAGNADRTNAVAAALTVPFRLPLPRRQAARAGHGHEEPRRQGHGRSTSSGAASPKAEILYENTDWPMEKSLQQQLARHPDIGVVNLDNVRIDSAGGGRRSSEPASSRASSPTRRSLSTPRGWPATAARTSSSSSSTPTRAPSARTSSTVPCRSTWPPGATLRNSWPGRQSGTRSRIPPKFRHRIDAELLDDPARTPGRRPLDESVGLAPHDAGPRTVGGILKVNGFRGLPGELLHHEACGGPHP